MNEKFRNIFLTFLVVLLCCVSTTGCADAVSLSDVDELSKFEAFMTQSRYEKAIIDELIIILNNDDAAGLEGIFADEVDIGSVTGFSGKDICDFIDGDIISYEKRGQSSSLNNGGINARHYNIDFNASYLVKTEKESYRLFYHFCFCNNEKSKIGMQSLGVSKMDYEDGGYMYYEIPGVFICTPENKDFILDLKEVYGR